MDRSNVITLIAENYSTDEIGQYISTETTRDVYCNIQSVTRSEFFSAGAAGLSPELVATMFVYDYQGEQVAQISFLGETRRYGIYRTYIAGNDMIELYLERKQGNVN